MSAALAARPAPTETRGAFAGTPMVPAQGVRVGATGVSTGPPGPATGPPGAPFASVLEQRVARTALAEGQHKTGKTALTSQPANNQHTGGEPLTPAPATPPSQPLPDARAATAPLAQSSTAPTVATSQQAPATAQPSSAPTTRPVAPAQAPDQTGAQSGPAPSASADSDEPAGAPGQPAPAQPAHTSSQAGQPTPSEASSTAGPPRTPPQSAASPNPSAGTAPPARTPTATTTPSSGPTTTEAQASPTPSATVASNPAQAPGAGAQANGGYQSADQSNTAAAPGLGAQTGDSSTEQRGQPSSQTSFSATHPPTAMATAPNPSTGQTSTASVQPAVSAPTLQVPSRAGAPLPIAGVGLPRMVEAVRTAVELTARQGGSQASIQLSPASLGRVRVQLRQTSSGLVARIVADHPDAAQTLAQGGDDLRRSLQQAGIALARLDIETCDQQGAPWSDADPGGAANGRQQAADSDDGDSVDPVAPEIAGSASAAGGLVNVLA